MVSAHSETALPVIKLRFTPSIEKLIAVVGEPEGWVDERGNVTPGQFSDRQTERMEDEAFHLLGDHFDVEIDY